ncbi:hypothetical protein NUACC21_54730 [Scytonema sp. NUACC21]
MLQEHLKILIEQAPEDIRQLFKSALQELDEWSRITTEKLQIDSQHIKLTESLATSSKALGTALNSIDGPNPGEPLQPLTQIASGGEMSRFLLALKACFSQVDTAATLVFDEIDVGVSGRVAQAIAEKLYQLGNFHQVLCVTHQPLVAAMADRHFRVAKQIISMDKGQKASNGNSEQRTVVRVTALDNLTKRREELAQLAGGKSAQEAIAFAESLLTQAANHRHKEKR